ncbi:MAG: hypothetical protein J0I81_16115 [Hyphomicrobium sp.]|nr:hypothetical protein [Hyphomicrobium sp.]
MPSEYARLAERIEKPQLLLAFGFIGVFKAAAVGDAENAKILRPRTIVGFTRRRTRQSALQQFSHGRGSARQAVPITKVIDGSKLIRFEHNLQAFVSDCGTHRDLLRAFEKS